MRDGDLREAGGARQLRHAPLMLRVAVAVHQGDGHRLVAGAAGLAQPAPRRLLVQWDHHGAVGAHAFVHLEDATVHRLRQADVEGEDVGAVLVADAQRVAAAARGHEERALAAPLEQGIGGHCGAHAHLGDERRGERLAAPQAEEVANALHGGVVVAPRVLRQQLARGQSTVGTACHHVGERAAPVDPEAPAGHRRVFLDGVACHERQATTLRPREARRPGARPR